MMNRWWNRLSFRMPALIVLMALIPLLGFGVVATRVGAAALIRQAGRANRETAARTVELAEASVGNIQEHLIMAVSAPAFSRIEYEAHEFALQLLLRTLPDVKSLTVLDDRGNERVKSAREKVFLAEELTNRAEDVAFEQAIQGQPYIGPVRTSDEGIPTMSLAVPIWNLARGKEVGVLMAEISLRSLLDEVVTVQVGQTGYVYLVDDSGTVIAHPDLSLVLTSEDLSDHPYVKQLLMGQQPDEIRRFVNRDGVETLTVGATSPKLGWIVIVEEPVAEALAVTNAMTQGLNFALAIVLLLAGTVTGYFVRRLMGPLRQLEKGARIIGGGNLDFRIEVEARDEIGQLADAFNEMTDNLRRSLGETARGQRLLLALSQAAQAVQRARTPEEVYRTVGDEVARLGCHAVVFTLRAEPFDSAQDRPQACAERSRSGEALTDDRAHLVVSHMPFESAPLRAAEKLTGLSAQDYRFPLVPGGFF
ncbi:MAG: cache domain-containing protein, partial [Anaerolineae bacterium]